MFLVKCDSFEVDVVVVKVDFINVKVLENTENVRILVDIVHFNVDIISINLLEKEMLLEN